MSLFRLTPKDPSAEAERLFTAAAEAAAPKLGPLAAANGRTYVTERYELQPIFRAEVEHVAAAARPRPSVSPRLKADLSEHYTGIGPFDISLEWSGAVAYGELKAGEDTNASANCIWDAPKLALMVRLQRAASGHLIAAAPSALWTPRTAGLELFFDAEWDMLDLRKRHPTWWRKWEREKLMPLRIPASLKTIAGARVDFACNGVAWTLGLARVEPMGEKWVQWPPFYPERWETPVTEPERETPPSTRPWRERFPNAEVVVGAEGGAVYAAEAEGAWWVITNESAMADFVEAEDADLAASSVKLRRFDDRASWLAACDAIRERFAAARRPRP